ncbi:hypothetical protein RCL_jg24916.t1 [Rhizophagus clarus]|uniref:Uncharacterized protein n=1 Tax=Rhizophagus clarus TaxID=94130 RepID=A0A8H3LLN7_9GLOM|nr:hypothetical protein RCL_jg24916.t1 [Rhizophagus clarus]
MKLQDFGEELDGGNSMTGFSNIWMQYSAKQFSSFSWDQLDIGDSVVIISKVWTWILIISQVSDGIPAGKSAPLKPDKVS